MPGCFAGLARQQIFVVDHIAKPCIRDRKLSPWKEKILELAKREHVYCKLSGMVSEAAWEHWQETDLRPYFDVALQAFGPERLMFGSDWPVLLLECAYSRWAEIVRSWIAPSRPPSRTPFCQEVHAGPIPYEGSRAANPASLLISQ